MSRARADQPQDPPQNQDLVLIHGWGMNAGVWKCLPESPRPRVRLHPIELPGHGGRPLPAPREGGPETLGTWADACLEVASPGAVWLGWSLGGLVALAAALRTAERDPGHLEPRIRGLVLMTATPRFVRALDWPTAMPTETLTRFKDGLLADPVGTLTRFLALQVRGDDQARQTLRRLRQGLAAQPAPDPVALSLGLDLLRGQDLRSKLRDLCVPTLWIFGSHDTLVPAAVAPRIGPLIPEARTCVIPGAAHAPFLSHPVETWGTITDFLDGPLSTRTETGPSSLQGQPD